MLDVIFGQHMDLIVVSIRAKSGQIHMHIHTKIHIQKTKGKKERENKIGRN